VISRIWDWTVRFIARHRSIYLMFFPAIVARRVILRRSAANLKQHCFSSFFENVEAGSLVVRIPAFQGSFEMDVRSHLLKRVMVEGEFEPDIVQLAKRHIDPTRDVIDVGANVGFYTVLFSKLVNEPRRVLAVEPAQPVLKHLRGNISRNGCTESVIVFEGIAIDKRGSFRINVIPGMEEFSSVGEIVHPYVTGKATLSVEAEGDTLDNLVRHFELNPGFIKIDVEGGEYLVLEGAANTIQTCRPVIVLELNELLLASCGATSQMVLDFLGDFHYRFVPTSDGYLCIPK
jgi:FkbM family methyltransferase